MPSAWQTDDVGSTKSEERRKNVKLFFLYLAMVAIHLLEGWDNPHYLPAQIARAMPRALCPT